MVKWFLPFYLFFILPVGAQAQDVMARRGHCTPDLSESDVAAEARPAATPRRLPAINRKWDAERIYKQAVILISFSDTDFSREDARDAYDKIFNAEGYNEGLGTGCVADYFREQSAGLFNLQFDVYGPYKVTSKAQPYDTPTETTHNYGRDAMTEATRMWIDEHPDLDYKQYDWNGNGQINQVVYVYAGYCGNEASTKSYGHIWPNTSTFSTITTPDGVKISNYTASAELWVSNRSCGIGTICHEFSHSLGLPDIYPVNGWVYSVVDEWDLMDGGNFTNRGWCPPCYSALEKMLLGWLEPVELDSPATITDMKTLADDGVVYQIHNTESEYYLLENRQWDGWDAGLPGHGLVIFHVNYDAGKWSSNAVNNTRNQLNYRLIHADNKDYDTWDKLLIKQRDEGLISSQYQQSSQRMNSYYLSGSAYPLMDGDEVVNDELTDGSSPAAIVYNGDTRLLSKPITGIREREDGIVSFEFMGGAEPDGIVSHATTAAPAAPAVSDLQGRRLSQSPKRGKGVYIYQGKKIVY